MHPINEVIFYALAKADGLLAIHRACLLEGCLGMAQAPVAARMRRSMHCLLRSTWLCLWNAHPVLSDQSMKQQKAVARPTRRKHVSFQRCVVTALGEKWVWSKPHRGFHRVLKWIGLGVTSNLTQFQPRFLGFSTPGLLRDLDPKMEGMEGLSLARGKVHG